MPKSKRTPPDKTQCQAEYKEGSFMTFGPRKVVRCKNKPTVIATEINPGKDGLRGSMSLCDPCLEKMLKAFGTQHAIIRPIRYGGKEALPCKK